MVKYIGRRDSEAVKHG